MSGAKPHHIEQPCAIPMNQTNAVKLELLRQINLGTLVQTHSTELGMPVFVVPKPDGSCCIVADFRELNKATVASLEIKNCDNNKIVSKTSSKVLQSEMFVILGNPTKFGGLVGPFPDNAGHDAGTR